MKKTKIALHISALFLITMIAATAALAQQATRVNFARGATQAVVSGTLNNYQGRRVFLMRVRAGQTLSTEQIKGNNSLQYVTVSITDPSGAEVGDADASCNSSKEVSPTVAGDYKITVVECQKADPWRGQFRVRITVR